MKVFKLLWILFALSVCFVSCDDDDDDNGMGNEGTQAVPQVAVSFEKEGISVLKNAGEVQIPLVLAEAPEGTVKLTVGVKEETGTVASEGIDFDIKEKVISIEKGVKVGYVTVVILDNGKAETDRAFTLELKSVYGYGKKAETAQTCKISIMNNAFAEFEKTSWVTYESAATESAPEDWKATCRIPILITGVIAEPSTIVVQAKDETAHEYYNFTIASKEIAVNPGDSQVYVEILPIDDDIANDDRTFNLFIKEIKGGNLIVGKNNLECSVTIVSEEIKKTVSFESLSFKEYDIEIVLDIPVVIDKVPEGDVTVTLAPAVASTAVEGVDYELTQENRTIIIGESKRANVYVKLLGDNIVNGDRQLILALRSVKGANASLSEQESECTIDILNDDFPAFEKSAFEVEEYFGEYTLELTLPAVDKERVMKFDMVNKETQPGVYFSNVPTEVVIPANADKVNISMNIGINVFSAPTVSATLEMNIVEVDGFRLAEPIAAEVKVMESQYRKFLGTWNVTSKEKNFDQVFSAGTTEEEMLANWNKKYLVNNWTGSMDGAWKWKLEIIDGKYYLDPTSDLGIYNDKEFGTLTGKLAYYLGEWKDVTSKSVELKQTDEYTLEYSGSLGSDWYDAGGTRRRIFDGRSQNVWKKQQ